MKCFIAREMGIGKAGLFERGVGTSIFNSLKSSIKIHIHYPPKVTSKQGSKIS